MKKVFKFMAIAMIAVSLPTFVACSNDEEEDNPDNPTTQASFTADFGSEHLTITDFRAIDYTNEGYLTVFGYTNYNDENAVYVNGFLESTVISGATYQSTGGDIMNYRDPNYTYTDNDGILGQAGTTYWGWNTLSSSFIENVTAIDLNALTMSANWTSKVFDITDYIATSGNPTDFVDFNGEIKNMPWVWETATTK